MKKNAEAPQGVRLKVVAILAIPLVIVVLLIPFSRSRPLKSVEPQIQISVQKPASTPVQHMQEIAYVPPVEPASGVAPETEAALAQFGLSAKNGIKLSVVARSLPPVILPKTK